MITSHQIVGIGPSLAASLEPLAHHQNVASLSLFCSYHFGSCSSELPELVPLPQLAVGPLVILIGCMIFLSSFVDVIRMALSTLSLRARPNSRILCPQNAFF